MQYGAARAGVVLVNVNPAYRSHELRYVLQKSRIRALFLREHDARANYRAILDESRDGEALPLEHVIWLGEPSWDAMLAGGRDFAARHRRARRRRQHPVHLRHHRLAQRRAAHAPQPGQQRHGDRARPARHRAGPHLRARCRSTTASARVIGSMVSRGHRRRADPALRAVRRARHARSRPRASAPPPSTACPPCSSPNWSIPDFDRFDLTSLRTGVMAGAPCPIEVMRTVAERMHCREMTIAYGQTEASPVITMSRVDDPMELRVTTVGAALANTEVQIVDPESGERVPVGEQGELCTRGYLVMKGYDEDPEATAAAIDAEGWLHTGDLAVMRPDGYFSFSGRAKDMIIRGGENIYPREVEDFLHTHPKIADVYVIGMPDARLGETVLAWVQLKARRRLPRQKRSARSAAARSRTSRSRSTSASWMPSP